MTLSAGPFVECHLGAQHKEGSNNLGVRWGGLVWLLVSRVGEVHVTFWKGEGSADHSWLGYVLMHLAVRMGHFPA